MTAVICKKTGWHWFAWIAVVLVVVIWLAWPYVDNIVLDDAYITYRYARHLAESGQLVYNLAKPENAFAATAPAYAIFLAGLHRLGADIPRIASILGTFGILLAAWALGDAVSGAARDSEFTWPRSTGFVAGSLLAFTPILWLVLGMEGLTVLALTLLGLRYANRRQETPAAVLLGLATVLRFDAIAAAAAWGLLLLLRRRWQAWKPLILYAMVVLVMYGAMHFLLGVPLPATLASKQAQVALGISGFFPHASYLDGLAWIAKAYWMQSPAAFGLVGLLTLVGLIRILATFSRSISTFRTPVESVARCRTPTVGIHLYMTMLLLWTGLHLILYVILKVTPYLWYYLPFVPALCALCSVGLSTVTGILLKRYQLRWLAPFAFCLLVAAIGVGIVDSHQMIQDQFRSYSNLPLTDPRSAVLPGSQVQSYRQAGEWLEKNTPEHATVGVTDLGIIGYFSQRPMIDFWGLLDRNVASALARRDLVWALYTHQPDYLALFGEAPLVGYDVFKDRWFQSAYEPIHRVPAGKVTIYRRRFPPSAPTSNTQPPPNAVPLGIRFGDVVELTAYSVSETPWSSDTPLHITYYWHVLKQPDKNYTLFTHLLDSRGAIIAGRDAPPLLGARPMSQWRAGEFIADFHPLGIDPLPLTPTEVSFEVGMYDQSGQRLPAYDPDGVELSGAEAEFGRYPLLSAKSPVILAAKPPADTKLAIQSYDLGVNQLENGKTNSLSVIVANCDCPLQLTAELWDEYRQRLIWEQESAVKEPGRVEYEILVAEDEIAGWLQLRLRARKGDVPLLFTDPAGQPIQDTLPLTTIQLSGP